jgi:electron transport complex protein RnfB
MNAINIIWAFLWFALLSGFLGALLALAAKLFAIKTDERVETVAGALPGANCGGCGAML